MDSEKYNLNMCLEEMLEKQQTSRIKCEKENGNNTVCSFVSHMLQKALWL